MKKILIYLINNELYNIIKQKGKCEKIVVSPKVYKMLLYSDLMIENCKYHNQVLGEIEIFQDIKKGPGIYIEAVQKTPS